MKLTTLMLILAIIIVTFPNPVTSESSVDMENATSTVTVPISTAMPDQIPTTEQIPTKNGPLDQQQANNYTPLFIDGLAIIGWPYYQTFFPENSNFTLTYSLEANRSYVGLLFGDYLEKQVDLDIWLTWLNVSTSQLDILEYTTSHDPGKQDVLRFSVTTSGNYSVVIYNHVSLEEFSFIGFVLLEEVSIDTNMIFFVEEPMTLPLEVIPRYRTHHGLFIPWKKTYQDVNLTITIDALDNPVTINASAFLALKPTDLLRYDPYLPEMSQHAVDIKTISTSSSQNTVSMLLGPQEKGWMQFPGIIVFIQVLEGTGKLSLSIDATQQFDIQYTTPLGVPQYFTLNQSSNYFTISYYLDATVTHDAFLWVVSPPDQSLAEKVKLQLWKGSPLETVENFLDPNKVPLVQEESSSATKHVERFKPPSSGRYTFLAYLDTREVNSSTTLAIVFNVFERWDLKLAASKEFPIVARNKVEPTEYTLQSFKTFFIPINQWNGKNITFRITVPENLELEAQLVSFTTMIEQLKFTPFSHASAIIWKKGLNEQLTLFSEVGRRNKDKVNDTYWVLSVIGIAGSGIARISWTESNVPINWVDLTITGTILIACLVILIMFAWKGEKYLHSF